MAEDGQSHEIIVIGAGLSGLACAFELAQAGSSVHVMDRASQPGGVIQSERHEGFLFEHGPNTVPGTARAFRALTERAGLASRLVTSRADANVRFLFHRGRLSALPTSPLGLVRTPLLSLGGKLALLRGLFRKRTLPAGPDEPSFEQLLRPRIGAEATTRLAGAFVRGVYAAEIGELGARSAFPRLWNALREAGSLFGAVKQMGRVHREASDAPARRGELISFPNGLHELIDALGEQLGERLVCGEAATRIERTRTGWVVHGETGSRRVARRIVLAVPAAPTVELLEEHVGRATLADLRALGHASVAIVHLALDGEDAAAVPAGFGFLVPPDAPQNDSTPELLGVLFGSHIFEGRAPAGSAAVTCIFRADQVAGVATDDLGARALRDLSRALGITLGEARFVRSCRWNDVIPRYGPGHDVRMQALRSAIESQCSGIHLAGNYDGGAAVDDCVARGRNVALAIQAELQAEKGAA